MQQDFCCPLARSMLNREGQMLPVNESGLPSGQTQKSSPSPCNLPRASSSVLISSCRFSNKSNNSFIPPSLPTHTIVLPCVVSIYSWIWSYIGPGINRPTSSVSFSVYLNTWPFRTSNFLSSQDISISCSQLVRSQGNTRRFLASQKVLSCPLQKFSHVVRTI